MKPTLQLRDYQAQDVLNIETAWKENRSVLYQLPTGGGKSVVLSKIVLDYHKNENILIFAHKKRLLTQLYERLNSLGIKTGLLHGSRAENVDAKCLVVSIRTAVKDARLETLLKRKWDRVIIDEARHTRTNSYDKVLEALLEKNPIYKLLGVDATPYRKDKKRLDTHFQTMVLSTENVASLMEKGYLAKCQVFASPIDIERLKEEVKEVAGDYQMTALSNYMRQEKFINYVVSQYTQYGEGQQAIVFAVDIAHAKDILAAFKAAGYTSIAQIDSQLSDAEIEEAFSSYEKKETKILVNVEMITEGVDLPETNCIVLARPTKSLTLYLQMAGRGTRPKSDGSVLTIIDCAGCTEAFGTIASPRDWTLNPEVDPNNPRTKNKVVGKKEDGTYTEDLTDFIGEIVEMTPEEYIEHLQGGLQSAQKVNDSIDDKIKELLKLIEKLLKTLVAEHKVESLLVNNENKCKIYYLTKRKLEELQENNRTNDNWYVGKVSLASIDLKASRLYAEGHTSIYNSSSESEYHDHLFATHIVGHINNQIMTGKADKVIADMKGLLAQTVTLEKSKLNLQAYREEQKRIEQERKVKAIEAHLAEHKGFTFPTVRRVSYYFPKSDNYYDQVTRINVSKVNKHHNTITMEVCKEQKQVEQIVMNEKGEETKVWVRVFAEPRTLEFKYVKGEKIMEWIEGEWNQQPDWMYQQES